MLGCIEDWKEDYEDWKDWEDRKAWVDRKDWVLLIFGRFLMKIPCGSGLGGHWGLELVPRGSQRGIRGLGWSKNVSKKANNAGHNGPRRPPEGQSGESWDHFEVKN